MNHSMYKLDQGVKIRITEKKIIKAVVMAELDLRPIAGLVLWFLGSPRHGSWIDADWFSKALKVQASSGVWWHVPQGNFRILTPQRLISSVSESFRLGTSWLSKPCSSFQLVKFCLFTINVLILLWKIWSILVKQWKPVLICACYQIGPPPFMWEG